VFTLRSIMSVYASTVVGAEAMSGASYQCKDSIISKNVTLPGGDVSYAGNENCRVFGLAPGKITVDHKLDPLYSELKAIRAELDELKVFRNVIIAVLAVLMIAAMVNGLYVWQQHRRR
jgi:hypothetical protein